MITRTIDPEAKTAFKPVDEIQLRVSLSSPHLPDHVSGIKVAIVFAQLPIERDIARVVAQRVAMHFEPYYRAGGFGPIPLKKDREFVKTLLREVSKRAGAQAIQFRNMGHI